MLSIGEYWMTGGGSHGGKTVPQKQYGRANPAISLLTCES